MNLDLKLIGHNFKANSLELELMVLKSQKKNSRIKTEAFTKIKKLANTGLLPLFLLCIMFS
jgi:hypothetical protein